VAITTRLRTTSQDQDDAGDQRQRSRTGAARSSTLSAAI
jgi:hypothetical protein